MDRAVIFSMNPAVPVTWWNSRISGVSAAMCPSCFASSGGDESCTNAVIP